MVVSKITRPNGLRINNLRVKNGLDALTLITINNVLAGDGEPLSSERIRRGEINRQGVVYQDYFKKTIFLPTNLRKRLRQPLGKVFKNTTQILKFITKSRPQIIIAVGDIISQELEKKGFTPDVKIIDYRSRRQALYPSTIYPVREVEKNSSRPARTVNTSGTINHQSVKAIDSAIKKFFSTKKSQTVVVKGEEDLLALPAIMLSPLDSHIYYGHWQLGVIGVEVNCQTKEKITRLLKKFN